MTKAPTIEYATLEALNLDPTNPRLGRRIASPELGQAKVMDAMRDWTLDELAVSFMENGFWPQEALIAVKENLYGKEQLVVVEGNRRLAALKFLSDAISGRPASRQWAELAEKPEIPGGLFTEIPHIVVANRKEVSAYLGFRHVTGIKEWNPAEKAQYIAKLIEEENLSYDQVRRRIGSKTPTVRQNYISYRLLLQMDEEERIEMDKVESKFSVLYLSLRTQGAQSYLSIDIKADPDKAIEPVPKDHIDNLVNFSKWLFGDKKHPPLFTDSRQVDTFGKILESKAAIEYLERTPEPRFEVAYRMSGVGEQQVIDFIEQASDNIQLALSEVYLYRKIEAVSRAVKRLSKNALALFSIFPAIKEELVQEAQDDAGSA